MPSRSLSLSALALAVGASMVQPKPAFADCKSGEPVECCDARLRGVPPPATCGNAKPPSGNSGSTRPATSAGTSSAGKAAAEAFSEIWNQIQADREKERQQQAERDRRARTDRERQAEWDRRDRERERYYEERRRQLAEEMEILQRQVVAEEEANRAMEQERRRELTESALPAFDQIWNGRSGAVDQGSPSTAAPGAVARTFRCEKRLYAEGTWFGWSTYLGSPTLEASRFSAAPADMLIGEGETRHESAELGGSSHRYWTRLSGRDLELRYERVSAGRVDSGYELRCSEQGG